MASITAPLQVVCANDWPVLNLEGNGGHFMQRLENSYASTSEILSVDIYSRMLLDCSAKKSPDIHIHVCNAGLETHNALGNLLVTALVESGRQSDAQQVFNRLAHPNESAWTSLIQGYIDCGDLHHAFSLFCEMLDHSIHPSRRMNVALLKASGRLENPDWGLRLHAEIIKQGDESDLFVGSTLVDMYAKRICLDEAKEVLEELPARNVVSWTALITGYAEQGLSEEALNCLERMQREGLCPDAFTVVSSLKACGNTGALEKGRELHTICAKQGFGRDPFVGNSLVDMYIKCGMLEEAQVVFDKLPARDVVSWNILLAGQVESKVALSYLKMMKADGVSPNVITAVCILKCCGNTRDVSKGLEMHADIIEEGYELDPFVGTSVVDMYAKCGLLAEAQNVFNELTVRGVVSWTALIAGYAEHGCHDEAIGCLEQMVLEGMPPNAVTLVCSLKACDSPEASEKGRELHAEIIRKGIEEEDSFVSSALVDMYAKCGALDDAHSVFDLLSVRDVVSYTALIAGNVENGCDNEALNCYYEMHREGLSPLAVTFASALKACIKLRAIDKGQEIHADIVKKGSERDHILGNTLLDMYAKGSLLGDASYVFEQLPIQDVVSWTALMAGYTEQGFTEKALSCFEVMQLEAIPPDIASWNALILGYVEHEAVVDKALSFYAQTHEQGLLPNCLTFATILKSCGSDALALETAKKIWAQVHSLRLDVSDIMLGNALIDLFGKCGSMLDAQMLFDRMWARDLVTWNALIIGYARHGENKLVLELFKQLVAEGLQPDGVTLLSVLSVCNHAGLVETGQECFQYMKKDYSVSPTVMHHNTVVDLLGRAGQAKEALEMAKRMPFQLNCVTWSTVMDARQKSGKGEHN